MTPPMSGEPRVQRNDPTPWALVALLGSLTALGPLAIDMYLPALPSITRGFHATTGDVTLTLGAFFFGLGLGQLFNGPLSDRVGRRGPILVGCALFVVGSVGCALAPSMGWMIAARFVQALGGSAGQVVGRASVRDRFDHQMSARILSLMMLVMGLAPIVAPIIGGYLLVVGDWRLIFWFQAAVAAAIGVWCFFRLGESRTEAVLAQARGEHPLRAYLALLRQPRLIGYALSGAFNGGAFFTWLSLAPTVLIEIYHISPQNFGWVFGINAAGFIAMNQVNAHLLRTYMPEEVLARARLVSIVFAVVLAIDAWTGFGGMLGVLIPLYLTLGSFGFVGPNTQASALNVDPTRTGSASSLVGAVAFGMGALISSISGFLNDGTVRPLATLILVLILLSSAALYAIAKPLHRTA